MKSLKTMLRTSRNSALLLTVASGLYMVSCSSEVKHDGGEQEVPETEVLNYDYTVFKSDPSRIKNVNGTRATENTVAPTKELALIAEFAPLNYEGSLSGDISATCVSFDAAGNVYASYHLKDGGSKGLLEVINYDGTQYTAGAYMQADRFDFNHLTVDGNTIVAVGNNTFKKTADDTQFIGGKGAFIGTLPTSFATTEGLHSDFKIKGITTDEVLYVKNESGDAIRGGYVPAGDANCVVADGGNYYVAADLGYGVLSKDLKRVPGTFVKTAGHSKHIAKAGNTLAVLSLDGKTAPTSVTVGTFDISSNKSYASVLKAYSNKGSLSTLNGKNTVAIDGTTIYACLSDGGLLKINEDGSTFTRTFGNDKDMPVNGVAVDDNYVYVAAGSFVYVLDKTSDKLESVCHYTTKDSKSANYVALNNGKLFVAYGKDGILVFELKSI